MSGNGATQERRSKEEANGSGNREKKEKRGYEFERCDQVYLLTAEARVSKLGNYRR
jgi:hypothetical protein